MDQYADLPNVPDLAAFRTWLTQYAPELIVVRYWERNNRYSYGVTTVDDAERDAFVEARLGTVADVMRSIDRAQGMRNKEVS